MFHSFYININQMDNNSYVSISLNIFSQVFVFFKFNTCWDTHSYSIDATFSIFQIWNHIKHFFGFELLPTIYKIYVVVCVKQLSQTVCFSCCFECETNMIRNKMPRVFFFVINMPWFFWIFNFIQMRVRNTALNYIPCVRIISHFLQSPCDIRCHKMF